MICAPACSIGKYKEGIVEFDNNVNISIEVLPAFIHQGLIKFQHVIYVNFFVIHSGESGWVFDPVAQSGG